MTDISLGFKQDSVYMQGIAYLYIIYKCIPRTKLRKQLQNTTRTQDYPMPGDGALLWDEGSFAGHKWTKSKSETDNVEETVIAFSLYIHISRTV